MPVKQVYQLKKGDVILPTNRTVTHAPIQGLKTPRGKVEIGIDGFLKVWGKYTTVNVKGDE